jgi:hypothetical protein
MKQWTKYIISIFLNNKYITAMSLKEVKNKTNLKYYKAYLLRYLSIQDCPECAYLDQLATLKYEKAKKVSSKRRKLLKKAHAFLLSPDILSSAVSRNIDSYTILFNI